MAETLKDPSKPAGYVFPEDVNEDGTATRNDGRTLKSARKNPWYVLATLYGEHEVGASPWDWDDGIVAKNRRAWNGWACAGLSEERRAELAKEIDLDPTELRELGAEERADILKRFRTRIGDEEAALPDPGNLINFSKTYFENPLGIGKHEFSGAAYFDAATFSGEAYFRAATFSGPATFDAATFSGYASFRSADFRSTTYFRHARFETHVPEFYAAKLYDDTSFEIPVTAAEQRTHWPPVKGNPDKLISAKEQKRAYNRLRLFMNQSLQTESEQFFHRREMECKKELALQTDGEGRFMFCVYWLYEKLSDYGYSVARPLVGLAGNVVFGWLVIALVFYATSDELSGASHTSAFGVSFSNAFAFLGFGRIFLGEFYKTLSADYGAWLVFLSGLQTVLGFVLLFLLGLGLRSRFRLR